MPDLIPRKRNRCAEVLLGICALARSVRLNGALKPLKWVNSHSNRCLSHEPRGRASDAACRRCVRSSEVAAARCRARSG